MKISKIIDNLINLNTFKTSLVSLTKSSSKFLSSQFFSWLSFKLQRIYKFELIVNIGYFFHKLRILKVLWGSPTVDSFSSENVGPLFIKIHTQRAANRQIQQWYLNICNFVAVVWFVHLLIIIENASLVISTFTKIVCRSLNWWKKRVAFAEKHLRFWRNKTHQAVDEILCMKNARERFSTYFFQPFLICLLKVRQFQNDFFKTTFLPKNERINLPLLKYGFCKKSLWKNEKLWPVEYSWTLLAHFFSRSVYLSTYFVRFLEESEDTKKTFRNKLTFD